MHAYGGAPLNASEFVRLGTILGSRFLTVYLELINVSVKLTTHITDGTRLLYVHYQCASFGFKVCITY